MKSCVQNCHFLSTPIGRPEAIGYRNKLPTSPRTPVKTSRRALLVVYRSISSITRENQNEKIQPPPPPFRSSHNTPHPSSIAYNPRPPPPRRQVWRPNTHEQILALLLILTIKLHFLLQRPTDLLRRHRQRALPPRPTPHLEYSLTIILILPRTTPTDLLRFQNELANLIPLTLVLGRNILPPQHATALRAADVADRVRAGH